MEVGLEEMLDAFIDDLASGTMPQVYDLLAAGVEIPDDLIPLLNLSGQLSSVMPDERAQVRLQVLRAATSNPLTRGAVDRLLSAWPGDGDGLLMLLTTLGLVEEGNGGDV